MLMRQNAPDFKLPSGIDIFKGNTAKLDNGIPVHIIEGGTQDVVKIDFIFPAGVVQAEKPLVASFTNNLMQEGTKSLLAEEIAEKIDFFGAFMGQSANYHHAQISLYVLTSYLPQVFPIVEDIIKNPSFSQHEFDVYLSKKKQDFMVDSEKVKVLASRKSNEVLFGKDHPYGRVASLSDYDNITREDCVLFHKKQYTSDYCKIIVSGKTMPDFLSLMNKSFGGDDWSNDQCIEKAEVNQSSPKTGTFVVEKPKAVQSAIKIVRQGVIKSHPDYIPLLILNTIFGGYFGSRLMNNLREEKGLTYGISSYLISYLKAGVMGISTEVLAEKRDLAVAEIFVEMKRLREELIDQEELDRVKNYMLGELMRSLDGPFSVSDAYRGLLGFGLDYSYYERFEQNVLSVTRQELKDLANKYLVEDDFCVVIAG